MFRRKQQNEFGRYDQLPNVQIDESRIPAPLRKLLPFARAWSISCDEALERAIQRASREEITRAVEAALPLRETIYDFAYESLGASTTPVPDEVVLFQMFAASLERLRFARRDT